MQNITDWFVIFNLFLLINTITHYNFNKSESRYSTVHKFGGSKTFLNIFFIFIFWKLNC